MYSAHFTAGESIGRAGDKNVSLLENESSLTQVVPPPPPPDALAEGRHRAQRSVKEFNLPEVPVSVTEWSALYAHFQTSTIWW